MDTRRGTFTSAHELLDLLRRRQAELGLSNEGLESLCGFAAGVANKYLGPSREKFPGLLQVSLMMDALGLSGELVVDLAKVRRMTPAWRVEGQRRMAAIRTESTRVSKAMLRRAKPVVLNELRSKGGKARWADVSVKQRSGAMRNIVLVRWNRKRQNTS